MLKRAYKFLFFFISLSLLLAGCADDKSDPHRVNNSLHTLPTTLVKHVDLPVFYRSVGTVISDNRVEITSRITGFIKEISVKEGQNIEKGQVLVQLDNADIEGVIQQALAAKTKAQTNLQDAQTDFIRYQQLYKRGSVSENSWRKVRLAKEIAESALREADAAYQTALSQRQYIRIISPVDGIVINRQKRQGDLATPGTPIVTIESDTHLLFEGYVPESQIKHVKKGQNVTINVDALKQQLNAKVIRVIHSGDRFSRRYQVKLELPETPGLLSGMFGYALFPTGIEQSPVIPLDAKVNRGGLDGVFVLDDQNIAHFRWLRLGREWDGYIQIHAGLTGGERIVAVDDRRLREGDQVQKPRSNQ